MLLIPTIETFLEKERIKYNQNGIILGLSYRNCKKIYVAGNSMTTVPTKKSMIYRIGGQSIPMMTTLLLILVDEGYFRLDEKIGDFLPRVPNGHLITLEMLTQMRSGLEDVIKNPVIESDMTTQVFKQWCSAQLLEIVYNTPPLFPPGERFYFGHITNMLLLGTAIKMRMKTSIKSLINKYFIKELNLENTQYHNGQNIAQPTFHTFTNNRISYYEDSTFWNSSWGSYSTKINADASDVNTIAVNIGTGSLISKKLFAIQTANPGEPSSSWYGMGLVIGGFGLDYLIDEQHKISILWTNESDNGNFGIWAYIPRKKICINIQSNTYNGDNFSINMILQDFLNTYSFKQMKQFVCIY